MGGEAMLEAKEKGWSDEEAMEMFAVNLGFGVAGGRVLGRSLTRIDSLTDGYFSKYVLSLAKEGTAPAKALLTVGRSALEGGVFGMAQSFGAEAWAKLRNLGDGGQRPWTDIWNDAKNAGVQNALTMALTALFAAGTVPQDQRTQLVEQARNDSIDSSRARTDDVSSQDAQFPSERIESPTPSSGHTESPGISSEAKTGSKPAESKLEASEASPPVVESEDASPTPKGTAPSTPEQQVSTKPVSESLAQRVARLHEQVRSLRSGIQSIHEEGSPESIGKLVSHLDALKVTEGQFHDASQELLNSVPENIRTRIERAAAPDLDHAAIRQKNAEDPTHSFATAEIGNAFRNVALSTQKQRAIRKTAHVNGVDPVLADRIADQAVGAQAVRDLGAVLRKENVDLPRLRILKQMGLVKRYRMRDGKSGIAITDDALPLLPPSMQRAVSLYPKALRVVHTKGPPADGLNRIVDGGRQRFANTADAINRLDANHEPPFAENTSRNANGRDIPTTSAEPVSEAENIVQRSEKDRNYQRTIERIHYAHFRGSPIGKGAPMTLTLTKDGRVIVSMVGQLPPPRSRSAAKAIFGSKNVEFVPGGSKKSGHHSEIRGSRAAGDSAAGARQFSSHYACDECAETQKNNAIENMTGTARDNGGKITKSPESE